MVNILFVRKLKSSELEAIERGKSSKNIFIKRRCQILLASAKGKKSIQIAKELSCSAQTVRNAIKAFNQNGVKSIQLITQIKLIPSVSTLIQQANKQKEKGRLEKAISAYHSAIELYPSSAWSYHYLGEILIEQGNLEEAITCYHKAIKFNPTVPEHYNKLGEVYFQQRQLDIAVDYFKKAISLCPNSAWYYQNLGESFAQKHKWGAAVSCYRQALKLNPDEVLRYHNSLNIEPDNPDTIKVHNPVFIVGCGHSGTSIMLAILGNHPAFYPITYESALFKRSESEIRETMLQWDKECIEAAKKRWIEKTPPHIFHIKRFLLHRPQSKFIIMLRDGRDVVCSLKYRTDYKNFEERVERWIYDNLAGLPYWNHPNVIVVKYEDLIGKTEITLKKVFSFLEESYTSEILDYYKYQKYWYHSEVLKPETILTQEDHHRLRNWQINQPLFDGRGRWQQEMVNGEKELFKHYAQQYLEQFSYETNSHW